MNQRFLRQMKHIHRDYIDMGFEAAKAIELAIEAYDKHDQDLAQQVIENDERINEYEIKLEKKTSQLIALQQPVATNLRKVIAVLKSTSDIERIADHAVEIAKAVKRIDEQMQHEEIEKITLEMSQRTIQNLQEMMQIVTNVDEQKAMDIAQATQEDRTVRRQVRKLIIDEIQRNPQFAAEGLDYMDVVLHLGRMNGYIVNLAEWVIYQKNGKITELTF